MANGVTNKGKAYFLNAGTAKSSLPSNLFVALITDAVVPDADTNVFSELTEIPVGNGYTSGGQSLSFNATDFDVLSENDTDDRAEVQVKDLVWTASGGTLPSSGAGARYAVLLDDNATVSSRSVYAWWDLTNNRIVSSGQTLTLQDLELRLT